MVGYEGSSTLAAPAIAISVVDVVSGQLGSLTFGVSSDRKGTKPEVSKQQQAMHEPTEKVYQTSMGKMILSCVLISFSVSLNLIK